MSGDMEFEIEALELLEQEERLTGGGEGCTLASFCWDTMVTFAE